MADGLFDRLKKLLGMRAVTEDVTRPSPRVLPLSEFPERAVEERLSQLVALKMYELGMPLDHVHAQSPSISAAIHALTVDMLAEEHRSSAAAAAQFPDLKTAMVDEWQSDAVYYDRVRRLATALHIPFDDLTDLDTLAKQHEWTRDTIAQTLEGLE